MTQISSYYVHRGKEVYEKKNTKLITSLNYIVQKFTGYVSQMIQKTSLHQKGKIINYMAQ